MTGTATRARIGTARRELMARDRRAVARAAPVMSSLRMNPRAVVRLSRPPNSSAARLEVSTTIGRLSPPARRSATANPSMPGNRTSSRTSSGRSVSAATSAASPSAASPTTVNPSASRSPRAKRRKPAILRVEMEDAVRFREAKRAQDELPPWWPSAPCPQCTSRVRPGNAVGAAPRHARLLDRRAATPARLAGASVDPELLLHRTGGVRAVAEIRALALDAAPECSANSAAQSGDLLRLQHRPQDGADGVAHARAPRRRRCSQAGHDALVEEHRLERCTPPGEPLAEKARRKAGAERLGPRRAPRYSSSSAGESTCQVPKRRTSRYDTPRAVVEVDDGALVRGERLRKAAGHAQVDDERESALEADDEVLAAPLDGRDTLSGQLRLHLGGIQRHRQPVVVDAHARDRAPEQARLEPSPVRLHLGQLRHRAVPGRTPDRRRGRGCSVVRT